MSTQKIKAVRFDRVSSSDQRDGYSLEAQRTSGEAYAQRNHLITVKAWSEDESASKEEDRIKFFEMVKYVKDEKIKAVIFDKVDRACRGLKSAVEIEEMMNMHDVRFHFTRENLVIDKNSPPQEKLRFNLGIILAKYYIDNLKTEIHKGINAKLSAGVWNGKAPFGYRNVKVNGKSAIEINDDEFSVGAEVFQLYSTGNYGYDELTKIVSERSGRKSVTKRLIENMLSNPFYYGAMLVKGKVLSGSHKPMISKELFDACQKIRGIRSANARSTKKGLISKPLMGVFTCGECDHAITGEAVKKPSGKVYVYYRCANHKCPQQKRRIEQTALFDLIKVAFEPFKKWTPKATKAFMDTVHASLDSLELYTQKMTGELAEARIELKKRIEAIGHLANEGKLSRTEYEAAVAIPLKLLEDNTVEIQAYQEADLATFQRGVQIIQLFQKAYDYISLDGNELEKVKLIKAVLSNPKLKDRSIGYEYEKPLDVLLTLTTVPVWWSQPHLKVKNCPHQNSE